MCKIELTRLELTNYRNIDRAVLEFDGNSKIIGENRIGKTNTLESIYYLLTNYLLDGSSDVSAIKPTSDTKKVVSVFATFNIGASIVTIGKEFGEDWVKTRGSNELVFKGHFTNYYYQGVKQGTLKEFNALIEEDFGVNPQAAKVNMVQLLINPYYLGNMGDSKDWTNLRTFIIDLVGDVTDEDIFKVQPSTELIKEDLQRVNGRIDQLKKQYTNDIKAIEEQIIADDGKIQAYSNTVCPTDDEIAIAEKGIEEHETKIAQLRSGKEIDTQSNAIKEKIVAKQEEINTLREKELATSGISKLLEQRNEIQNEIDNLYNQITDLSKDKSQLIEKHSLEQGNKENLVKELEKLQKDRLLKIAQLKEIDAKLKNPRDYISDACPVCHRKYEEHDIEDAIQHLQDSLNEQKVKIIGEGKAIKDSIINVENAIQESSNNIKQINDEIFTLDSQITKKRELIHALQDKKNAIVVAAPGFNVPSDEMLALTEELNQLKEELRQSENDYQIGNNNIRQAIFEEQEAEEPFKKILADRDYYVRQQQELEKAKMEKLLHEKALADIAQKKELVNTFIFTKLKLLDNNVSRVFGNIKFKLIDENINGGFDPICKPYIYNSLTDQSTDVLWKSGSKSERVITGIAICECVKRKLNLPDLPYLFDEGGEISSDTFATRIKTESQLICVKVQDGIDKPTVVKI